MMIRQRGFRIGQRVKLRDSEKHGSGNAYPLPPGSDGEEVTVIGFDHGYMRVLGEGRETTVFLVNIDCGWDEWADGKGRERTSRGTAIAQGQAESPAKPHPQHRAP